MAEVCIITWLGLNGKNDGTWHWRRVERANKNQGKSKQVDCGILTFIILSEKPVLDRLYQLLIGKTEVKAILELMDYKNLKQENICGISAVFNGFAETGVLEKLEH